LISLNTLDEYRVLVESTPAILCYFSTSTCRVCKVLKPKVLDLISEHFPEMKAAWIDIERAPLVAGQQSIFTAPTILVYFKGKETLRKSRNISIAELEREIGRIYGLLFKK